MKIWQKIISFVFLFLFAVIITGCNKNEFYPASDLLVTNVDPYSILPTSNDFSSISDGVITVELLNAVPCNIVGYDISYKTSLKEPIDNLSVTNIPTNIPIREQGGTAELTIKPYSQQLLDLFQNTSSNISPVEATVTIHFKDINKNETLRTATFLLYKYEEASSE